MLQAKHTDYDGTFLLAAATEQCHTWRKWEVDSAQLCQALKRREDKERVVESRWQLLLLNPALRNSTGGIF